MSEQSSKGKELVFSGQSHAQSLAVRDVEQLFQIASVLVNGGLAPKGMTRDQASTAIMLGMDVGLSPVQAITSIAVINGRPVLWGDAVVALCQASGQLEYMTESWDESTQTASCRLRRRGLPERVETFSMSDAKRAKLDSRDTYKLYPQRMCKWRARSWALRAEFADVLKGVQIREEVEEYQQIDVTPAIDTTGLRQRLDAAKEATASASVPELAVDAAYIQSLDEPDVRVMPDGSVENSEPSLFLDEQVDDGPVVTDNSESLYKQVVSIAGELGADRTVIIARSCHLEMSDVKPELDSESLNTLLAALKKAKGK